ncbi:MAG: sulfurtransferase TusA family protein [Nannocystaceae bacterium]
MPDVQIDCKGQSCPMPIVNISRAMKKMGVGQRLGVEASDPAFRADLEAWCHKMGHELQSFEPGDVATAVILKRK